MKSKPVIIAMILFALSIHVAYRTAASSAAVDTPVAEEAAPVTVRLKDGENRRIALSVGRESIFSAASNADARSTASADFDSDGVADLVIADDAGIIRFLKGNRNFLLDPQTEPFLATESAVDAGFAPDFFESGDFNGDGKQDLIAARRGDRAFSFISGTGDGNFAMPVKLDLDGALTTLAVGEYGRADGQTDIVVAEAGKRGPQLRVFEHPAGAVKHKPETIALPAPATFVALGFLGADGYSDIAVACGSRLVLVQGRGQVTPWDSLRPKEITRPKPVVSTRMTDGVIEGLAIGDFTGSSDQSIAVLTNDGSVLSFAQKTNGKSTNFANSEALAIPKKSIGFLPSDVDASSFLGLSVDFGKRMSESTDAVNFDKLSDDERARFIATGKEKQRANDAKARENFLRTVAAVPVDIVAWESRMMIRDASLAGARGLIRARVGYSGRDDLIALDSAARRLQIIAETNDEYGVSAPHIFSLESDSEPIVALPLRLNLDAKSDLVVLRKGASRPTLMLSQPSLAVVVNSNLDGPTNCQDTGGTCTLRSAIELANSNPGTQITFNISGSPTITPQSQLPGITGNGTVISATTPDGPTVEIDGSAAGFADGLKIRTSDAVVAGFAINSFNGFDNGNGSVVGGNGITIESTAVFRNSGNNWVFGNYLGTDLTGTIDKGNFVGLNLFDTHDNLIGQTDSLYVQIISGNGDRPAFEEGLGIIATNSIRGRFYGNIVGLDATGQAALPNLMGVLLTGSNNDFGGDGTGQGNLVSGNRAPEPSGFGTCTGEGIFVVTLFSVDANGNPVNRLTFGNLIQGNFIGTDGSGAADLGNCREGILLSPDTATSIGSISESGRNTISGNGYGGVSCLDVSSVFPNITTDFGFCAISGNNIGTDVFGNVGIPNDFEGAIGGFNVVTLNGINVYHNLNFGVVGLPIGFDIGGSCTGLCNLVNGPIFRSGHYGDVGIFSNYVGTNKTGVISLTNYPTSYSTSGGIQASRGNTTIGDYGSINGVPTSFGNLISGNYCGGLNLSSDIRSNMFGLLSAKANLIGTDAAGLGAIPNNTAGPNSCGEGGVRLENFYGNIEFGGTTPETKNIVSGNLGNGINVGNGAGRLEIKNTYIGININQQPLGNSEDGISIFGAGDTVIGGTDPNRRNIIRHNGKAGIAALAFQGATVRNLTIVGNSIFANGELGIDLMRVDGTSPFPNDGVNQNDCFDADDGANSLQNFPELLEPLRNSDGTVTINGVLTSTPLSAFRIDFYASSSQDSTEHGEGEIYIGSVGANTDGNGFESFSFTSVTQVNAGLVITATATNEFGETSEFSCIAGGCGIGAKTIEELAPDLSCAEPIIVNIATDEPDADTNDSVCDVDVSANNGLQCSLRAALQQAANLGSANVIGFDIPGGGVHVIAPLTPLPPVTKVVSIDGTSQPGYADSPMIELSGVNLPPETIGLEILESGAVVDGLAVNRFLKAGISTFKRTTVRNCYIGLSADGLSRPGAQLRNQDYGILSRAEGLVAEKNVLAFNGIGIMGNLKNARISGNKIGVNREGKPFEGFEETQDYGILSELNTGVLIGSRTDLPAERNIVGNSLFFGISLNNSTDVVVRGNYIGVDATGETPAPNKVAGIEVVNSSRNLIRNNLVSSNGVGSGLDDAGGVRIKGGSGNTVVENKVGMSVSGQPLPNRSGIMVESDNNRIGTPSQPNVICSNLLAGVIVLRGLSTVISDNRIEGNLIGINNGAACPNHVGVRIGGDVKNTTISRNTLSGNDFGIHFLMVGFPNRVEGNIVGLDPGGTSAVPNYVGIAIEESQLAEVRDNTISGNVLAGVQIGQLDRGSFKANGNVISANRVGTDITGTVAIPNEGAGIIVSCDADSNLIGGENFADANVISGNAGPDATKGLGLAISGDPCTADRRPKLNRVFRNRVGLAADTDAPLPNNYGIFVTDSPSNMIGGDALGNEIAGNIYDGIKVRGAASTGNTITGNTVVGNGGSGVVIEGVGGGTPRNIAPEGNPLAVLRKNNIGVILNAELGSVWSNGGDGVKVLNSINVQIGDLLESFANSLCSAAGNGITIENSAFVRVLGNRIGTDQVGTPNCGNSQNGVFITNGSNNNTVGGPEEGSGNTITGNGGDGVEIDETAGNGNLVDPNSIFGNGGLGIDLNSPGLTQNDPDDADGGANRGQNYPQISDFSIDGNGDLIVQFSVDSSPVNSDYGSEGLYIEFFKADNGGEGQRFLGSARYLVSDYNGALAGLKTVNLGNAALLGFQPGNNITSTATDNGGNTSEFSPVLSPTAASVTVAGRVLDANGTPVRNSKLTLRNITTGEVVAARSNDFGKYRFDGIEVGATYVVTVAAKGLVFSSSGSLVTVDDSIADLDFIADR